MIEAKDDSHMISSVVGVFVSPSAVIINAACVFNGRCAPEENDYGPQSTNKKYNLLLTETENGIAR